MRITRIEDGTVVMSDDNMTGRRLYASTEAAVIHMTIEAGRSVEPHAAAVDMEFYVLEGEAVFTVGDEVASAGPGALVASPKNLVHGIRNPGTSALKLLAIKNLAGS